MCLNANKYTIPCGWYRAGVRARNGYYHNSRTIYGKWNERTLVVRPLILLLLFFFSFMQNKKIKGRKNPGDYVNFYFGHTVIAKIILLHCKRLYKHINTIHSTPLRPPTEVFFRPFPEQKFSLNNCQKETNILSYISR